jgi:arginyl-tRNA synthetase
MNLEDILKNSISQGFKSLFEAELKPEEISLQPTKKEFEGTFTFTTFQYAKQSKKSPEETGKLVGEYLKANVKEIGDFNVVKGFLNIAFTDQAWLKVFKEKMAGDTFGLVPANGEKVMVEYSSPNTNKPLHLGHLRNNFLGYSVSEILKACGYNVVKVNLVNDRGIHICKSMLAYSKFGNNETPESSGLKGDHLIGKYYVKFDVEFKAQTKAIIERWKCNDLSGLPEAKKSELKGLLSKLPEQKTEDKKKELEEKISDLAEQETPLLKEAQEMLVKWENEDKEVRVLWEKMNGWVYEGFNTTYKMIGVDFDKFYYESDTYLLGKTIVEEGLKKKVFYKKEDGSVWVDLTAEGLDEKLLLRSDGTSVYITQDLGTADLKYNDYKSNSSLYVVGNEQDYHFVVLKHILKKLERPYADGIYHLSYGMVDLPSGRMKSREGTVVDADELVQEMIDTAERHTKELGKIEGFKEQEAKDLYRMLALGALKYFLLKVDPKKRMLFNPEESIEFHGNTGPFIQYTHARISAILRKARQLNIPAAVKDYSDMKTLQPAEKDVIVILNEFPKKLMEAGKAYAPSVLAQYVYDLAKEYNRFYSEVPVFNEEDKAALSFRIAFSEAVARTIKKSMFLLGIEVPDRM